MKKATAKRLAGLADVLDAYLGCGSAQAAALARIILDAAAAEHGNPGAAFVKERKALHRVLAEAEQALKAQARAIDAFDLPAAIAIQQMRVVREGTPLPPSRTGRPWAWGRTCLWPILAAMWCRFHIDVDRIPATENSPFVGLVDAVHSALGIDPPNERTVCRAIPLINRNLHFWQMLAPDFRTLAVFYHRS
ncbi:hypothetical protein ACD578_10600 [Microvirga sp. RSM25]|uniref:hypothetical protein n=1 Tax=Microvirga sp. RSM25 TaxID=3273802 RepID=UPI00384D5AD7